jgi:RNA polymerase sigma-32 factor
MSENKNTANPTSLVIKSESSLTRSKDLLDYYMKSVRNYPILTQEEEKEYALRYLENEDPEAAEKLVTSNLRLVIKIAYQYHRQWANVLDLIQEGNVGLVEALSRYDPYREIRFSSYAQYWIRAMILRFLLDNFRMVRLGSTRAGRKLFFQLQKERDALTAQGIDPTTKLLAQRLGVTEVDVQDVDQHMRAPALSFDAPVGGESSERHLSEVVSNQDELDPEEKSAQQMMGSKIKHLLSEFQGTITDKREVEIWNQRMVSVDPVSLSQLGVEYGVSKERIRQVESRIKKRLKAYLLKELGSEIEFEFLVPDDQENL